MVLTRPFPVVLTRRRLLLPLGGALVAFSTADSSSRSTGSDEFIETAGVTTLHSAITLTSLGFFNFPLIPQTV